MSLPLFVNPNLRAGVGVTFLFMATFGTLLYNLTGYFQNVHGCCALTTGLAFLPPMAAGFVGSMTDGRLATRFGIRATLVTSLAVGTVATAAAMSPDGGSRPAGAQRLSGRHLHDHVRRCRNGC